MANPVSEMWQKSIDTIENPEKARRAIYQFMPAALEIQETPPSPVGRAIIWSISLFFVIAIVWGLLGKADIVAVAPGKIISSGRVKTIQPLEAGVIGQIHVSEGQTVEAGAPLVTLDNTLTQADASRLSHELRDAEMQLIRLIIYKELLQKKAVPRKWRQAFANRFDAFKAFPEQVVQHQSLLAEQVNEYLSKLTALNNEMQQRRAESDSVTATIDKLTLTLPIVEERAESLRALYEKDLAAKANYMELEQQRIEQSQDLISLKAQMAEVASAIDEIKSRREAYKAEALKTNFSELTQANLRVDALRQELIKATQRNRQQTLYAPIEGAVQQLSVHTVGGVVTPAQVLMLIVPKEDSLEVEAYVQNKDIGFVNEQQVAEVKIDAFNFTKYGTIDAEIVDLSNDAIQNEEQNLVFLAKVQLEKHELNVNGKWVNLTPGMAVTVEIKTGQRRLIEYFLSPLLRYKSESIRER